MSRSVGNSCDWNKGRSIGVGLPCSSVVNIGTDQGLFSTKVTDNMSIIRYNVLLFKLNPYP